MTTRRYLGGEVRVGAAVAEDGRHYTTLRAIEPYVVDDYGSVWLPDVFDKSLKTRLPVMAWSHDWSDPIGIGIDWKRIGEEGPDVVMRFDDFDSVPRSKQAYAQVSGDPPTIRDCSVGFSNTQRRDPTEDELTRWPTAREIIEQADLDEISLVLRGAVPGAIVAQVRMLRGERGPVDREEAGRLMAKVATGELDLKEGLTELEKLDTPSEEDDEAQAADDSATAGEGDTEAVEAVHVVDEDEVDAILAEADDALALIDLKV